MLTYLRLFRQRNFTLMTVADAISVLGDQIGWVALLWFAMVTTKHASYMGLLGLIFGLPGVLLGAVVGNVLDSTSHKKVLVTANVLLGIVFIARSSFFHNTWNGIKTLYGLKAVRWITLGAVGFNFAYGQLEVSLRATTPIQMSPR